MYTCMNVWTYICMYVCVYEKLSYPKHKTLSNILNKMLEGWWITATIVMFLLFLTMFFKQEITDKALSESRPINIYIYIVKTINKFE